MKVLFITGEYPPGPGGVGHYVAQMAAALNESGHPAIVATARRPGKADEERTAAGLVLRTYDPGEVDSPRWADRMVQIARDYQVDLIEGADHLGECASVLRHPRRPAVLIKVHASQIVRALQNAQIHYAWQRATWALARFRARKQLARERFVVEHADLETVCSQRLLTEMHRQGLRLPARIGVLPNPIRDPGESLEPESPYPSVLFVGRMEFLKGIQFLPEIFQSVRATVPEVRLRIAGADTYARGIGSMKAWLERRLAPQSAQVDWLGPLDAAELDREYRRAWVVAAPSLWDNFPMVVLESMVRGKAIVTTPHGGMPEMLSSTSGRIVRPDQPAFGAAVVQLLTNSGLRAEAGRSARAKALQAYSPRAVAEQYVRFVEGRP